MRDGSIQLTFGNRASNPIAGKIFSLRPAVVEAPIVLIAWVGGSAEAPDGMKVYGQNITKHPRPAAAGRVSVVQALRRSRDTPERFCGALRNAYISSKAMAQAAPMTSNPINAAITMPRAERRSSRS